MRVGVVGGRAAGSPRPRAAVLVAVCLAVVIVVVSTLAIVRSTRATTEPPAGAVLITGVGTVMRTPGQSTVLCIGIVLTSLPPQCGSTVALRDLDWRQVPNVVEQAGTRSAEVQITGWWADNVLTVTEVGERGAVSDTPDQELPAQLCTAPSGSGAGSDSGLDAAVESLPGFQGVWISYPDGAPSDESSPVQLVYNVAVLEDVPGATAFIERVYDGPLCVGTLPGISFRDALEAADLLADPTGRLGVLAAGPSLRGGRSGVGVDVFLATDEVVARIHDAVGPSVAPYTHVTGQFHVVD